MEVIREKDVQKCLEWKPLVNQMELAFKETSARDGGVVQPPRLFLNLPTQSGALLSMPAFSLSNNALGCKLVTSFLKNPSKGIPSILANILLFDHQTGQLQVIIEGTEITGWRTAAASAAATQHLHKGDKKVLAILGAGTQGRTHALCFQHIFNFNEVRIWNRTYEKAQKLCEELGGGVYKPFLSTKECVEGADVICTLTYASQPIVQGKWIKEGAHINAVGAGLTHHSELDDEAYRGGVIVTDNLESAYVELKGLIEGGFPVDYEVGQVINGTLLPTKRWTIFHSLGMALEDVLTAKLVHNVYLKKKSSGEL